jgi:hypothetical protein
MGCNHYEEQVKTDVNEEKCHWLQAYKPLTLYPRRSSSGISELLSVLPKRLVTIWSDVCLLQTLINSFFHQVSYHHHYQSINVPTAGAQAFHMDYTQRERSINHHASPVRVGECLRLQM